MEILLKIAEYGIVAAVVGLIAFLICGFAKLFFIKKINAKYRVAETKAMIEDTKDTESAAHMIALDVYNKAKNQATMAIKKRCNLISTITGIVLLVPFYILILEDKTFYTDIIFWTNLFAIPTISALYYTLYQGLQDKNISVKVWLHKLVNLIIALLKYLKSLKAAKIKSSVSPEGLMNALSDIFPLSEEQKAQLLEKLKNQ